MSLTLMDISSMSQWKIKEEIEKYIESNENKSTNFLYMGCCKSISKKDVYSDTRKISNNLTFI